MANSKARRPGARLIRALCLAALLLFFAACSPPAHPRARPLEPGAVKLSLFALGDTGQRHRPPASLLEGQIAVGNAMESEDRRRPVNAVVLLGDNFYRYGLQREELSARIAENLVRPYCRFLGLAGPRSQEVASACPLGPGERLSRPIYAVLGNHDWLTPESPELQRRVLPAFVPEWRMPPEHALTVELGAGVSLILIESEPEFGPEHAGALTQALLASQGPWRILAAHRATEVDDWGALPLHGPYTNAVYQAIADAALPVHLVVSGHHHSMQIVEGRDEAPPLHVIVGSGSRSHPIEQAHQGRRFESTALGFARVDLVVADAIVPERLIVSLFGTADVPLVAPRSPPLLTRWSVDAEGVVRDELE